MPAPKIITELVTRYRDNEEAYRRDYGETETRREFLDPFFRALGWDIENTSGHAEAYKDVVHEDNVKVGSSTQAPDYSFRIGGTRKFFLEAKRPAVNIQLDGEPAFQLRRYGWSAKMPLSILSNFAQFAIYDCRVRPKQSDKPPAARTLFLTFDEYEKRWEEIAGIFSKDALYRGSFDKYAAGRGKRGTAEVDDAFLQEIEEWRNSLARNIALRNSRLTQPELNFAVQQIIDRIIFLRISEDRGIEPYGRLKLLQVGDHTYQRLQNLFFDADERYNSGLFHFRTEKGRPHPDELTPKLSIDDKIIKDILKGLYYPDSPYEFSVLPADILGQVYEQFLGKVIRLTSGGHARVEEKPEVKKAGGVFYTPKYVVDFIVGKTVGALLTGSTPEKATRLRILDPACGSGSFLLGAYQYLLDWHRNWYNNNDPEKHARARPPRIFRGPRGAWKLTAAERKRILLSNIYGVDIDTQAVEVTKLSLLLKVLEEESGEGINKNWEIFHERALPDLDANIRAGNTLIEHDFRAGLFGSSEEELAQLNAFDWQREFPGIARTGFSAVIGNPPYGANFSETEKAYLFSKYPNLKGQPESYEYFLNRAIGLCAKQGFVSFIVPTNFIESERAEGLRTRLLSEGHIHTISNFRYSVWKKNAAEPLVIVFQKGVSASTTSVTHPTSIDDFKAERDAVEIDPKSWTQTAKCRFVIRADTKLLRKIESQTVRLEEICDLSQGIIVYKTREQGAKNAYIADEARGNEWHKLLDTNSSLSRYELHWGGKYLKYGSWLWRPREDRYFEQPKILFVRLLNKALPRKLVGVYDDGQFYNRDNFNNIIIKDARYSLQYVLALFNSRLVNYWYKAHFDNVNVNPAQVRLIPIRSIDFGDKPERAAHDELASLAERIGMLKKRLSLANMPHAKEAVERTIKAADAQIDEAIYRLYGLTTQDIQKVQAASAN